MKPPLRTKSIGTNVSEDEFAALEGHARARKLTLSEWVRAELLEPRADGGGTADEVLLGEVLALRTILLNLIARRGRNFGFRLISITQRPAKLNKDVLTQLSTLIALGVTSPQDRDAIKAWVDGNADREKAKEVYATLAALPVGEGWLWAPDHDILERVQFPAIQTLDTSKTPKAGEKTISAPVLAATDIAKITKQIEAIQTTSRANAPKKRELREPKRTLQKTQQLRCRRRPPAVPRPKAGFGDREAS